MMSSIWRASSVNWKPGISVDPFITLSRIKASPRLSTTDLPSGGPGCRGLPAWQFAHRCATMRRPFSCGSVSARGAMNTRVSYRSRSTVGVDENGLAVPLRLRSACDGERQRDHRRGEDPHLSASMSAPVR